MRSAIVAAIVCAATQAIAAPKRKPVPAPVAPPPPAPVVDEPPPPPECKGPLARVGSSAALALPTFDGGSDAQAGLATFREALEGAYHDCSLAPFVPRALELSARGDAYSPELEREVGKYRLKPDADVPTSGLEIFGIEMRGIEKGVLAALAPLTHLRAWPVRMNGTVVSGCKLALAQTHRAELCPDIDDVDRAEANVVSTQARGIVTCGAPLALDDIAVVVLGPDAPASYTVVAPEASPAVVERLFSSFNADDASARELACTLNRDWCIDLTAQGSFLVTRGADSARVDVEKSQLAGFTVASPHGPFTLVHHVPSGLRIAQSPIGSFHAMPQAGERWWLSAGDCFLWRSRSSRSKSYPPLVEIRSLCQVQGAWVDGNYSVTPLRGTPRVVTQDATLDDIATRCRYTK